jgi:myo-inositol-1(or 4)-monophosphatase
MSSTSTSLPALEELHAVRLCAEAAARQAGEIMRKHAGNIEVDKAKASYQDLVTAADRACQDAIEAAIRASFPTHDILGEESVPAGWAASTAAIDAKLKAVEGGSPTPWLWVIDPIDGTTNFVHGIPCSAVSVGVAYRDRVVVGVIYEPYRDEMFSGVLGGGATLNGRPVAVAKEAALSKALFGYGLHHTHDVGGVMCRGLDAVMRVSRGCRSLGSAALHLAYVSCGRLTGFWELDLSSWDVAAGSLLVTEAGGRVTDTRGAPYTLRTRDTFASNGSDEVHEGLLKAIASVGADSVPRKA